MTPERIEFWKNNTVEAFQLHSNEFDELLTIDPKDLQYQNCYGEWVDNVSMPLKNESLAYRLRPDYAEPQGENTREPLPPWACLKDAPNNYTPDKSPVVFTDPPVITDTAGGIKIEAGEDRVFSTGAKRQASAGKGLPTLLPPDALLEISKHLEAAATKYDSRNWEKGLPLSSILDSLFRHIFAELMGDTSEEHARAIGCNALFYIATKKRIQQGLLPSELDNLPKYPKWEGKKYETV